MLRCRAAGCAYAAFIDVLFFIRFCPSLRYVKYYARSNPTFFYEVVAVFFGFAMALAVTIAVGMLWFFQIQGILRNMTQVRRPVIAGNYPTIQLSALTANHRHFAW